jgi:monooxygenase
MPYQHTSFAMPTIFSDMYTFGFGFKPWPNANIIAPGGDILNYLNEAVEENDIRQHISFLKHVTKVR